MRSDWKGSGEKKHPLPETAFEYAKLVEPELGVPPKADLNKALEIPIYIDGERTLDQHSEVFKEEYGLTYSPKNEESLSNIQIDEK